MGCRVYVDVSYVCLQAIREVLNPVCKIAKHIKCHAKLALQRAIRSNGTTYKCDKNATCSKRLKLAQLVVCLLLTSVTNLMSI